MVPFQEETGVLKSVLIFFRGLSLGLHIEVAHAMVGSMANPQSKVVGVEYRFRSADVEFRCVGFGACKSQVWPLVTERDIFAFWVENQ